METPSLLIKKRLIVLENIDSKHAPQSTRHVTSVNSLKERMQQTCFTSRDNAKTKAEDFVHSLGIVNRPTTVDRKRKKSEYVKYEVFPALD